jgi:hypothetical protein
MCCEHFGIVRYFSFNFKVYISSLWSTFTKYSAALNLCLFQVSLYIYQLYHSYGVDNGDNIKISLIYFYSSLKLKIIITYSKLQSVSFIAVLATAALTGCSGGWRLYLLYNCRAARRWKKDPVPRPFLFSICRIFVFALLVSAANRIAYSLAVFVVICDSCFPYKLHDNICHDIIRSTDSFLPSVSLKQLLFPQYVWMKFSYCFP